MPSYYATRSVATRARQYEAGDPVTLSNLTEDERQRYQSDGAIVPARFVDTATNLAKQNPVVGAGLVAYETDTGTLKIGNGTTAYNSLTAFSGGAVTSVVAQTGAVTGTQILADATVAAALAAKGALVDVQLFTSSGTWTKPTGAKSVAVWLVSGGSGGGSGRRGAAASVRAGGGGGAGGSVCQATFRAADLGATVTVTVGAGGAGGAAVTADDTNGNNGTAGGVTLFDGGAGIRLASFAPGVGQGGTNANGFGGSGSGLGGLGGLGGAGGNGAAAAAASNGADILSGSGATGGGGGGGLTAADAVTAASPAGRPFSIQATSAGASLGAAGVNGGAAPTTQNVVAGLCGGYGGGGGGASASAAGQAGSVGGTYGGGGGGGSASLNGNNSGAGGAGGSGAVLVITYF